MKWYEKIYDTLWHYWFHITWKLWYSKKIPALRRRK